MKIKCYLIPISFFVLTSCNLREINYSDEELNSIKLDIMKNKEIISYSDYTEYMSNNSDFDSILRSDLLPYSLKMKEVDPIAYFDFFQEFLRINNNGKYNARDILKLSEPEQNLLIYYLEEGAKKEQEYCVAVLAKFYEEGIYYEKNVKKSDSLTSIIYPSKVSRP